MVSISPAGPGTCLSQTMNPFQPMRAQDKCHLTNHRPGNWGSLIPRQRAPDTGSEVELVSVVWDLGNNNVSSQHTCCGLDLDLRLVNSTPNSTCWIVTMSQNVTCLQITMQLSRNLRSQAKKSLIEFVCHHINWGEITRQKLINDKMIESLRWCKLGFFMIVFYPFRASPTDK